MATESYLWEKEKAIIDLIAAIKIEVSQNDPVFKINERNFDTWYSIKENTELLLKELDNYVIKL